MRLSVRGLRYQELERAQIMRNRARIEGAIHSSSQAPRLVQPRGPGFLFAWDSPASARRVACSKHSVEQRKLVPPGEGQSASESQVAPTARSTGRRTVTVGPTSTAGEVAAGVSASSLSLLGSAFVDNGCWLLVGRRSTGRFLGIRRDQFRLGDLASDSLDTLPSQWLRLCMQG